MPPNGPTGSTELAEQRARQRETLRNVPVWVFTGAEPLDTGVAPDVSDPAAEAVRRDAVDKLLNESTSMRALIAELESDRDVVITPEQREKLELLVHSAALADFYAADGYVDPRVESWQRPEGLKP